MRANSHLRVQARVAVGQMTATNDIEKNFGACSRLAKQAFDQGCALLALPECFAFIGKGTSV